MDYALRRRAEKRFENSSFWHVTVYWHFDLSRHLGRIQDYYQRFGCVSAQESILLFIGIELFKRAVTQR